MILLFENGRYFLDHLVFTPCLVKKFSRFYIVNFLRIDIRKILSFDKFVGEKVPIFKRVIRQQNFYEIVVLMCYLKFRLRNLWGEDRWWKMNAVLEDCFSNTPENIDAVHNMILGGSTNGLKYTTEILNIFYKRDFHITWENYLLNGSLNIPERWWETSLSNNIQAALPRFENNSSNILDRIVTWIHH